MKNSSFHIRNMFLMAMFPLLSLSAHAQVMEWAIKPEYKDIVHIGGDLYKVKSDKGKWGVYNISKRELAIKAAYDSITPLVEGRALILDAQGQGLLGIIDEQGVPVQPLVSTPSMIVMQDYPYYSDGLLVVGIPGKQWYEFGYVDENGEAMTMQDNFTFLYACPFDNGYAMVRTAKGSYHIIDKKGSHQYQGNTKIKFLSNPKNGVFVLATGNSVSKGRFENRKFKEEATLESNRVVRVKDATATHTITCDGGSTYSFDNAFHLIEGNAPSKVTPAVPRTERNVSLKKEQYSWLFGLSYKQKQLLEPQFKNVKIYEGDYGSYALVTMSEGGMKGLLRLNAVGKVNVSSTPQTITFYHNQQQDIPVKVECTNLSYSPKIELRTSGATGDKNYSCVGSGTINIPYYEAHNRKGELTTGTLGVDIFVDNLKFGHKDIDVKSVHQDGFTVNFGTLPSYSSQNHQASVSVNIIAINGSPSASAKAVVNGREYYFNGNNQITASVAFHTQQGRVTNYSVNVALTEDGCPPLSRQMKGTLRDYYDQ